MISANWFQEQILNHAIEVKGIFKRSTEGEDLRDVCRNLAFALAKMDAFNKAFILQEETERL